MAYYYAGEGKYDRGLSEHFREFHIFMNWTEYHQGDYEKIHTGHHVHIFITSDKFINQSLRNFIHKCQYRTRKPVIIHIPSDKRYELKNALTVALRFLSHDIYRVICNRKPVEFFWSCSYNPNAYKHYGNDKVNMYGSYEDSFLIVDVNGKSPGVCYTWKNLYPSWRHALEYGNKEDMQKTRKEVELIATETRDSE